MQLAPPPTSMDRPPESIQKIQRSSWLGQQILERAWKLLGIGAKKKSNVHIPPEMRSKIQSASVGDTITVIIGQENGTQIKEIWEFTEQNKWHPKSSAPYADHPFFSYVSNQIHPSRAPVYEIGYLWYSDLVTHLNKSPLDIIWIQYSSR